DGERHRPVAVESLAGGRRDAGVVPEGHHLVALGDELLGLEPFELEPLTDEFEEFRDRRLTVALARMGHLRPSARYRLPRDVVVASIEDRLDVSAREGRVDVLNELAVGCFLHRFLPP